MFQANENSGPAVYVTEQKSAHDASSSSPIGQESAPADRKSLFGAFSVKAIAYTSAAIIIILFLSITVTNLTLSKTYYQGPEDNGLSLRLTDKTQALESQLAFFNRSLTTSPPSPPPRIFSKTKMKPAPKPGPCKCNDFYPRPWA